MKMKLIGDNFTSRQKSWAEDNRKNLENLLRKGVKTPSAQQAFTYFDSTFEWKVDTCRNCGKLIVHEFSWRYDDETLEGM